MAGLSKQTAMRTRFHISAVLGICLLLAGSSPSHAQDQNDPAIPSIIKTIQDYYQAMAARDVAGLQRVLDSTLLVVEAARESAKVHVITASDGTKLLPPEGNDDWQNLELTDLKVHVSSTHPSVAVVSYSVFHPLAPDHLKSMQEGFDAAQSELDDSQRQAVAKLLADRGSRESECAMLVLRDGLWRIVSLSVPK